MKKIMQLACAVAVMGMVCSCGSKHQFVATGTVDNPEFDGAKAYLIDNGKVIDSTVISKGTFCFKGNVVEPWLASVLAEADGISATTTFIAEEGNISINLIDDVVSGTDMNNRLQMFVDEDDNSDLDDEMRTYEQLYYTAPNAEVRAQAERLYDSVEAIAKSRTYERALQLYEGNKTNALGAYAMGVMATTDRLTYATMSALLEGAAHVVKAYQPVAARLKQLQSVEQTSVGKHYTDVVGVDGKLSDLIEGRVALVDFYASWCPPCRAEIKDNLVPLWAKYKDKGLVIVGLNVWERGDRSKREAAHQKVMADLGITYPQLVDSTTVATDTYGVRGIPQIMLIGRDGTILARDLRGSAIEEAIVAAL